MPLQRLGRIHAMVSPSDLEPFSRFHLLSFNTAPWTSDFAAMFALRTM
jgi:hypothetical protein